MMAELITWNRFSSPLKLKNSGSELVYKPREEWVRTMLCECIPPLAGVGCVWTTPPLSQGRVGEPPPPTPVLGARYLPLKKINMARFE